MLVGELLLTKFLFMKTKILSLALLTIISTTAFSQKLHIGFKGGASINKLTGKSFKEEFSFGYHLGGFFEIGLGKKFGIQPEILFNQVNVDTSSTFSSVYQFKHDSLSTGMRTMGSIPRPSQASVLARAIG